MSKENGKTRICLFNKRTGLPISVDPRIGDIAIDKDGNAFGKVINAWYDNKTDLWGVELGEQPELHGK